MRFGLVHRIMTDALAVLGILAIVSTAMLGPWTNGVLIIGTILALAVPESWQGRPAMRHGTTAAAIVLFLVQGGRLAAGESVVDVTIEFAALGQVVRVATRRGAAHDQQIILLALMHFVAGTVLGGNLSYGLCFLGFLIVAPGALVLSHLRREVEGNYRQGARDRTGLPVDVPRILRSRRVVGRGFLASTCLMAIPIFIFTALLFVLFPRVGLSLLLLQHGHGNRIVGFSDHVDLGEVGTLRSDPAIAVRFELDTAQPPPPRLIMRLRGTAFDSYDGRAWSRTQNDRHLADRALGLPDGFLISRAPAPGDTRVTFDLEAIDPPVLFLPPNAASIQLKIPNRSLTDPLTVQHGPEGEFRYVGGDSRGLRYDVFQAPAGEVTTEPLSADDRPRYLTVPSSLPMRIAALAHEWADGEATAGGKARAIEDHLRKDFTYDITSPSGGKPQPVDHFLFESKRGHCEFFSTAMAMMLREIGIPSRNVTGFVGGTYNRFGHYYAVRQGDAHSWVEAYVDDGGVSAWRTFDPTPPAGAQPLEDTTGTLVYLRDAVDALSQRWNSYVVGYDFSQQMRLFEGVNNAYERARANAGINTGWLGKITRGPVVAGALLVLIVVAYVLWQRRRRKQKPTGEQLSLTRVDKSQLAITALYRSLESLLATRGVSRPASTPPLGWALALRGIHHPLSDEVLALTYVYLGVRFGGEPLTPDVSRAFEERLQKLKARTRQEPTTTTSLATLP